MWPILAGAALSAGSGILGTHMQNRANARMAREQMEFQERMSSTAWQRGVSDMRAAGINPMLAFQKGGASAPSGQTARMENVLGAGASNALEVLRTFQQMRLMASQTRATDQQALKTMTEGMLSQQMLQAFGQRLPGMSALDNVRNALTRVQLQTARQFAELQRTGQLGKMVGLDSWRNFVNLMSQLIGRLSPQ